MKDLMWAVRNKRLLFLFVPTLIFVFVIAGRVIAENTNSLDLERNLSQYAYVDNDLGITNGDITIELWFKPEHTPAGGELYSLVNKADAGTNIDYTILYYDNGGTPTLRAWRRQSGAGAPVAEWGVTLDTGTWYHIVLTYNGTAVKLLTATANGTHIGRASANTSGDGIFDDVDKTVIGAFYTTSDSYTFLTDGLIDDVRFWNDVRTSTELDNNFQTELAGNESGLVAYYKLNNDFTDATANGFDLSPAANSPVFSTDTPFGVPPITPVLKVRKDITQTVSSDTITDDDSELTLTLLAGKEYIIDGVIFASSTSGTPDIKLAFTTPSGTIIDLGAVSVVSSDTAFIQTSNVDTSNFPLQANKVKVIQITGTVKMGGTPGDVHFQWAQNTSNATPTAVLRGSYLRADEI